MRNLLSDQPGLANKAARRLFLEILEKRNAPSSIIDLGTLGGLNSYGLAINNSGMVVGGSNIYSFYDPHAYCYESDIDAMMDLGTLGGNMSEGRGINDFGQIVGEST